MKTVTAILAVLAMTALAAPALAEDAAGDWIGKVRTPAAELTIATHIKPDGKGGLQGYAESPDQTVTPIAMADIKATADTLSFTTPGVGGAFQGKWDAAAKGWVGTFTQQSYEMPLTLVRGVAPPRPKVAGLDGDWSGVLQVPAGDLRMKLHVKTDADGTLALFESPDQSPMQIVAEVTHVGDTMTIALRGLGDFEGKLSADGKTAEGYWRQGGGSLPLTIRR